MTRGSRRISSASPSTIAWSGVIMFVVIVISSCIDAGRQLIEGGIGRRDRELSRGFDLLAHGLLHRRELRRGEHAVGDELALQRGDRILRAPARQLFLVDVS